MTHDTLDDLLDRSAPATDPPDASALALMVAEATATPTRTLTRRRALAVGSALVVALVGGGAAVATAGLNWSGWVAHPNGEYEFTLPSGATCTGRLGDVESPDPRVAQTVEDWARGTDIMAAADVDAVIEQWRRTPNVSVDANGDVTEIVPGSPSYDADAEYRAAVREAVQSALSDHLAAAGLAGVEYTVDGEQLCSNDVPAASR